jgi:hypothetical protein
VDLGEVGCEDIYRNELAESQVQWWALILVLLNELSGSIIIGLVASSESRHVYFQMVCVQVF